VVTDNGQFVLDVRFARECDLRKADEAMHRIPGVIETGLFFGLAKKVLVGCGDGENLILRTLQRAE
jgi:ribose 5-phosphate isomerase A